MTLRRPNGSLAAAFTMVSVAAALASCGGSGGESPAMQACIKDIMENGSDTLFEENPSRDEAAYTCEIEMNEGLRSRATGLSQ